MQGENPLKRFKFTNTTFEDANTALELVMKDDNLTQREMIQALEKLLDRSDDPSEIYELQQTAVHLAVAYKMKDLIDYFVACKFDINTAAHFFIDDEYNKFKQWSTTKDDSTTMMIETESSSFVEFMISKGISFDIKNKFYRSAVYVAVQRNLQHILPVLLKHTKEITFADEECRTLLHLFLERHTDPPEYRYHSIHEDLYAGRYAAKIVKILLDRGLSPSKKDNFNTTAIQISIIQNADVRVVEMLIKKYAKIYPADLSSLLKMVEVNCSQGIKGPDYYYIPIFRSLTDVGLNVDRCKYFLLKSAFKHKNTFLKSNEKAEVSFHMNLLDLLVNCGCSVNGKYVDGKTPLHIAVEQDNQVIVQRLIELGAKVDSKMDNGITPLNIAVVDKLNLRIAELLRDNGADFRVTTNNGETLFHHLVKNIHHERIANESQIIQIFNLLLSEGCHIDEKDKTGTAPIHLAIKFANSFSIRNLIECGADVNCRNRKKQTPLHLAIMSSNATDIVKFLLIKGANVNARDSLGQTAINIIAQQPKQSSDNCKLIRKLLHYGADVTIKDFQERSALDCAYNTFNGNQHIFVTFNRENAIAVMLVLIKHSLKLKAAGFPGDETINYLMGDFKKFVDPSLYDQQYYIECLKEVEKLKNTLIDKRISFYTFLHMNPIRKCSYIISKEMQQFVRSRRPVEEFPEYSVLILSSYNEAVIRRSWLQKQATEALMKLAKTDLPYLCVEGIFAFLSNSDLFNMIEKD